MGNEILSVLYNNFKLLAIFVANLVDSDTQQKEIIELGITKISGFIVLMA